MRVTRIVANLKPPDPMALAKFCEEVFELDLPVDMGWIVFLSNDSSQKISIGVEDPDATEAAVRAAGADVVYAIPWQRTQCAVTVPPSTFQDCPVIHAP